MLCSEVMELSIRKNFLIEKRNVLNEIRSSNMSLQELRFFSIYLAKINARDSSTRVVRFTMSDFQKIMEFGKLNMTQLRDTADSLLSKIVGVTLENGDYARFQLFKKTVFSQSEDGNLFIEIDAHDDALPLMFEFKEKYFTYELWNSLQLKSSNQLRMYEILKQYEHIGERIISLDELKELLGLKITDYPRYNNFRICVLDVCQEALVIHTDIKFTYEPTGKIGRGSKVYTLKFTISHNENYKDKISLDNFIDMQTAQTGENDDSIIETVFKSAGEEEGETKYENENLAFFAQACNMEFAEPQMQVLYDLITNISPYAESAHFASGNRYRYETDLYDYLKMKYDEMKWRSGRGEIKNRFGYLKKLLLSDFKLNKTI